MQSRHLLGGQQQGLNWLLVREELRLLDDVDVALQADGLVQGAPVCKVGAPVSDPGREAVLPELSTPPPPLSPSFSPLH